MSSKEDKIIKSAHEQLAKSRERISSAKAVIAKDKADKAAGFVQPGMTKKAYEDALSSEKNLDALRERLGLPPIVMTPDVVASAKNISKKEWAAQEARLQREAKQKDDEIEVA